MKDIANKIGVSSVTISKALNDKEGVSEELKEKIKQLADEMGYRYNSMARSMKEGKTYNIGIVIPERFSGGISQSFYFEAYQYLSAKLEAHGYYGIMNVLTGVDEEALNLPRVYKEGKVDGFIFLGQINQNYLNRVKSINIPMVFLDFYDEHDDIDAIITDNFYGAYDLTNHLIHNGHSEIGFVGNLYSTSSIQDRFLGYYKSLLEHNIELDQAILINDRDSKGILMPLTLPKRLPTAFVCNCDQVANSLVKTLQEQGYSVPQDCSVVGFDNDIYATITDPQLTTVAIDIENMVNHAVRLMIKKVNGQNKVIGRTLVKGKIVKRDSVKNLQKL